VTELTEQPQLLPMPGWFQAVCLHCDFAIEVPRETVSFGVQHDCRPRSAVVVWPSARIETHSEEAA
jgi:hypothetical protein